MKRSIMIFYRGYLRIRLDGFLPERFLNLCAANRIEIWDLINEGHHYHFFIMLTDYRQIRPYAKKAQVHLKIEGRYGLPFFLHRNRRRKYFAAGIICFFLVLIIMSQFIWKISFEGNFYFSDDTLIHYLEAQNISYGCAKYKINCDELEESIRSSYPEILWVSARISGTCLRIRIKENTVIGVVPIRDQTPRDLVADNEGTVTKILVRQGRAVVKAGDLVDKGQLLVSGRIPLYNDSDEEIGCQYVRSDADIRIRTSLSYGEKVPYFTVERSYTGRSRTGFRVRIPCFSILLFMPGEEKYLWEMTEDSRQLVLLYDFYLPIWLDHIEAKEYDVYQRNYTPQELEYIKNQIHDAKMENLLEKGVQIIENNVRILDKSICWEIRGDFIMEIPAGIGQNIKQEEEQTKSR